MYPYDHPVVKKARLSYPVSSPWFELAQDLASRWEATVSAIQSLEPGDPGAEQVLREAGQLLSTITVQVGPIHGWLLAQRHLIFRHAKRLFGADQQMFCRPGWTEA